MTEPRTEAGLEILAEYSGIDAEWARGRILAIETEAAEEAETRLANAERCPVEWSRRIATLEAALSGLRELAGSQAEDEGLWFVALTAPEAYLQQELRKLHAAIETPLLLQNDSPLSHNAEEAIE